MSMPSEIWRSHVFRRLAAALFLASFVAVFATLLLAPNGRPVAFSLATLAWVALAATLVAGAGLAVVGALVIAPILKTRYRLREILKAPREPEAPHEERQRRDEIGDIAVAVERLRDSIAAADAERRARPSPFGDTLPPRPARRRHG
jgi:hypothetical protein